MTSSGVPKRRKGTDSCGKMDFFLWCHSLFKLQDILYVPALHPNSIHPYIHVIIYIHIHFFVSHKPRICPVSALQPCQGHWSSIAFVRMIKNWEEFNLHLKSPHFYCAVRLSLFSWRCIESKSLRGVCRVCFGLKFYLPSPHEPILRPNESLARSAKHVFQHVHGETSSSARKKLQTCESLNHI